MGGYVVSIFLTNKIYIYFKVPEFPKKKTEIPAIKKEEKHVPELPKGTD